MSDSIHTVITTLRVAEWLPITTVRTLIGVFFCISGGTKLFVPPWFRTMERTLAESHIPFPHGNAIFVSLVEFSCGAGLALGLLTLLCIWRSHAPALLEAAISIFFIRELRVVGFMPKIAAAPSS